MRHNLHTGHICDSHTSRYPHTQDADPPRAAPAVREESFDPCCVDVQPFAEQTLAGGVRID